jgi:hypothetical protein
MRGPLHLPAKSRPHQPHRKRIVQNRRMVHQLVRRAANGHAKSGLAGPACLHDLKFKLLHNLR